jgi:hypothetical protein
MVLTARLQILQDTVPGDILNSSSREKTIYATRHADIIDESWRPKCNSKFPLIL